MKQQEMKRHCIDTIAQSLELYDPYTDQVRYIDKAKLQTTDQLENRALHPWFNELTQSVGLIAGRGAYWYWADNYTVDPIVISRQASPKILLVQRGDNKKWALPGGFLDPNESPVDASIRECLEETRVQLDGPPDTLVYAGIVADERATAHAWPNTTALLWRPDTEQPATGDDDAQDADWFDLQALPNNLHGSHIKLIEFAMREL